MRKTLLILALLFFSFSIGSSIVNAEEKIIIPKTGIVERLIDVNEEVIAYRSESVIVTVNKQTKISKAGDFLMVVHVLPSERKKNQKWFEYVNKVCANVKINGNRTSVSPIQVDEILYEVAVNETNATCKVCRVKFFDIDGDNAKVLYSTFNKQIVSMSSYGALDKAPIFDAAYRKVIQWHREH